MTPPLRFDGFNVQQLGLLRDVLELIGRIRQVSDPITSPDGLRQTIELVLRFAELLGVSGELTDRLRQILADDNVFHVVLGIVRLLFGAAAVTTDDGKVRVSFVDGTTAEVEPQDLLSWLPIVVQIINLIRLIRGAM